MRCFQPQAIGPFVLELLHTVSLRRVRSSRRMTRAYFGQPLIRDLKMAKTAGDSNLVLEEQITPS